MMKLRNQNLVAFISNLKIKNYCCNRPAEMYDEWYILGQILEITFYFNKDLLK